MVLYDNNDLFPQYNRQKIFLSTKMTGWTGQTGKSLFISKMGKIVDLHSMIDRKVEVEGCLEKYMDQVL